MNPTTSSHSTPNTRPGGFVLALSTVVAALGSFLFGFDTAVVSGTTGALQFVLVWRFLPETKVVSLEDMEAQLGRH